MPVEQDKLLATFLDEVREHLDVLESGLLRVVDGQTDAELLNALFRAAHSIKGGSGVFGLTAVTRLTHALEQLLDRLRKGQLTPTRDRVDLLLNAVDGLRVLFSAANRGSNSAYISPEALVRALDEAAGVPAAAPAVPPPVEPAGLRTYRLAITPGPGLLTDGMDPLLLLRNLGKRGEILTAATDLAAVPDLAALDPTRCYLSWVVTVRTTRPATDLKDVFAFVESECEVAVTDLGQAVPNAAHVRTRLTEYEAAYGALLSWLASRLPELRGRSI